MITHTRDIQPALGHLEAALEASCASLIVLESTRDGVVDVRAVHGQITRAVESLRSGIAELRAAHHVETSMLAFGFVLDAPRSWRRGKNKARQVRPRRTA